MYREVTCSDVCGYCVETDLAARVKAGRPLETGCYNPDDGELGDKWSNSEYALEMAPVGFADGLNVEHKVTTLFLA